MPDEIEEIEIFASSLDEVAKFFDVNLRTVARWRGKGMPGAPRNYPLGEISRWLIATVWCAPTDPAQASSRKELEIEKLRVGNARGMLKLIKEASAVVDRAAALDVIANAVERVRTRLEGMPNEFAAGAPEVSRADVRGEVARKIASMMRDVDMVVSETNL